MYDNLSRVIDVDINEILPNRFQPRIQFDEEEILELSDSIKEHGVIQPLVVRTVGDKYEIIAGERRYKASVLAGKETVPVIVKNLNDKDSAEVALIENIQRKNLTPIEEALSYKKILDMGYITQVNLANKLGKSQSSVANKIRLLNLSDEVQEALLENKISERHARSLLKLSTYNLQNEMLNKIIKERLTVRKTDEEIEKMKINSLDENDKNSNKIIEKGELNMNNTMFGIPNVSQNSQPTSNFDIFGGVTPTEEVTQPQVETPVPGAMPTMEPAMMQQPTSNFDIFGGVTPTEEVTQPQVETPVPGAMPTMEQKLDTNENVIPNQTIENTIVPEVPQTSPIIQSESIDNNKMTQQSDSLFSFGDSSVNSVEAEQSEKNIQPEFKMPEPIIITDYSKQYDPIMPQAAPITPKVDFKEVINAIRECSKKIEQYGFKIDVEEYDFANLYQAIFKIEK